jgi:hypothetical protein
MTGSACAAYNPLRSALSVSEKTIWAQNFWTNVNASSCIGICESVCTNQPLNAKCKECIQSTKVSMFTPTKDNCNQVDYDCMDCLLKLPAQAQYDDLKTCVFGKDNSLSPGAIIGIIVGSIIGVIVLALIAYYASAKHH